MGEYSNEDDEIDEAGDADLPDEADMDDEDDLPTMPCPYCGKPVHEESEICPQCGKYISEEDAPHSLSWWMWAGMILCGIIAMMYMISSMGGFPLRW